MPKLTLDKKNPGKNPSQQRHRFVDGETMVMPLSEILRNRNDSLAPDDTVFNEATSSDLRGKKSTTDDSLFSDPTSTRLQTPGLHAKVPAPRQTAPQPRQQDNTQTAPHQRSPLRAAAVAPAPAAAPAPKPVAAAPPAPAPAAQSPSRPSPPPEGQATRIVPSPLKAPDAPHVISGQGAPAKAVKPVTAPSNRPAEALANRNQVVVFFSCKGGAGATALSINVAHHFARAQTSTCLVDMDLQLGDALAALALQPRFTIAQATDMVQKGSSVTDNLLPKHASGLSVLSQVGSLDDLDRVSSEGMAQLVEDLRNIYDVVVVDGVRDFSDNVLAVLDVADKIAIVTVQEVLAIRRARWSFNILRKIGFDPKDITIVVNRFSAQSEIPFSTIKRIFDPCLVMTIPAETGLVVQSLNRGVPLQELNPQHTLTRNIGRLANNLVGNVVPEEQEVTAIGKPSFWRRLLGK